VIQIDRLEAEQEVAKSLVLHLYVPASLTGETANLRPDLMKIDRIDYTSGAHLPRFAAGFEYT
jgi:hypothetical protein